jgi:DNA-binding protein HU-beta
LRKRYSRAALRGIHHSDLTEDDLSRRRTMATNGTAMTKAQLVTALSEKTSMTKKDVKAFLEALSEVAYKEVKKNKKFTLPGFGILKLAKRKARTGRNPATGEAIKIPAKTAVKFTVSKACKEGVLGGK